MWREAFPSSFGVGHDRWRYLWRLRLPNKNKIFCWRVIRDIQPTNSNLICKEVEVDICCALCSMKEESSLHIFKESLLR